MRPFSLSLEINGYKSNNILNTEFSFIILTFNEEQHLPRLLDSIKELEAPIFILDSGSTDKTLQIAESYGVIVQQNSFVNHPKQWHFALNNFPVQTPWIIGLDADQIVTPELFTHLQHFKSKQHEDINGIYFNRKNIFKGKWIRYGGYYPKYLLKMFRFNIGYSDLNENMDHRFVVPGKTITWKDGHIIEDNLKENDIEFWIAKHNRYSTLVAQEEFDRLQQAKQSAIKPSLFGDPNQKIAYFKSIWWKMPLYIRPFLYFFYRYFLKLGFLDGKTGFIFHYLQGFWFRLIIDIKISEFKKKAKPFN